MHRIFFLISSFFLIGHFYFGKSGHFHVALTQIRIIWNLAAIVTV